MFFYRSSEFKKRFKASPVKLQNKIAERLNLLLLDEFLPILNNHELHGEYSNCRSINISGDIRLVYKKIDSDNYLLVIFGTHNQLYE